MSSSANPLGPRRLSKQAVKPLRFSLPRRVRVQGRRPSKLERKGAIVVLAAFMVIVMAGIVALSVDLGALYVARAELQRSADSAALAAAAEMLDCTLSGESWDSQQDRQVRRVAQDFVAYNVVMRSRPTIDLNVEQNADGDLLFGEVADWDSQHRTVAQSQPQSYNAVQVRVARSRRINGEVPLFFAKIFGMGSSEVEARAAAAFVTRFRGFRPPVVNGERQNLPLLPFAVSEESLAAMLRGEGPDEFSRDEDGRHVHRSADGHPEINLYPVDSGAPGNWSIVDLGSAKTSSEALDRQIRHGLSPAEMDYHGGELSLDYQGELTISGDPGMKIGLTEPALKEVIGEPRIVPVYRSVRDGGTNAEYTITGFAGVCIVSVQLKGGPKHLRIQACPVLSRGGIPAPPGQSSSRYIYSPVALVN